MFEVLLTCDTSAHDGRKGERVHVMKRCETLSDARKEVMTALDAFVTEWGVSCGQVHRNRLSGGAYVQGMGNYYVSVREV